MNMLILLNTLENIVKGGRLTKETIFEMHPDLSDRDVGITHFNNSEDAKVLEYELRRRCHPRGFLVNDMGPTMATYEGDGGMTVSF